MRLFGRKPGMLTEKSTMLWLVVVTVPVPTVMVTTVSGCVCDTCRVRAGTAGSWGKVCEPS